MNNSLTANIDNFIDNTFPEAILQSLNNACQIIENKAVDNCPVDDGTLRSSITHNVFENNGVFEGKIGTNVEYAPYVHEGTGLYAKSGRGRKNVPWTYEGSDGKYYTTKGQKPNPFLQKALDENMDKVLQQFEGCL